MRLDEFDFELPASAIAQRPVEPRDAARLLHVSGGLADRRVRDLPGLLRPGDLMVFNDTRSFPPGCGDRAAKRPSKSPFTRRRGRESGRVRPAGKAPEGGRRHCVRPRSAGRRSPRSGMPARWCWISKPPGTACSPPSKPMAGCRCRRTSNGKDRRRRGPGGLSDHVRGARRRGGRPDRRAALHARADGAVGPCGHSTT